MGAYKKTGGGLFSGHVVTGQGIMSLNWKRVGLRLDIRKKFFTMRVLRHWNRLLKETGSCIPGSLQGKVKWDSAQPGLLEGISAHRGRLELDDLQYSFQQKCYMEIILCCSWEEYASCHPLALGSSGMGSLQKMMKWIFLWAGGLICELPIWSTRLLAGFGSTLASVSSFPLPCPVLLQAASKYGIEAFCLLGVHFTCLGILGCYWWWKWFLHISLQFWHPQGRDDLLWACFYLQRIQEHLPSCLCMWNESSEENVELNESACSDHVALNDKRFWHTAPWTFPSQEVPREAWMIFTLRKHQVLPEGKTLPWLKKANDGWNAGI